MPSPDQSCASCFYFMKGECRFGPPTPYLGPDIVARDKKNSMVFGDNVWPSVKGNDWCGEWSTNAVPKIKGEAGREGPQGPKGDPGPPGPKGDPADPAVGAIGK